VFVALGVVPAAAAGGGTHNRPAFGELHRAHNATAKDEGQGDANEVLARAAQESLMRTAPGSSVSAAAYAAAAAQAAQLGTKGGTWQALTDKPFLNDPVPGYRDPNWSDFGSGYGLVTGRVSALTTAVPTPSQPPHVSETTSTAGRYTTASEATGAMCLSG